MIHQKYYSKNSDDTRLEALVTTLCNGIASSGFMKDLLILIQNRLGLEHTPPVLRIAANLLCTRIRILRN